MLIYFVNILIYFVIFRNAPIKLLKYWWCLDDSFQFFWFIFILNFSGSYLFSISPGKPKNYPIESQSHSEDNPPTPTEAWELFFPSKPNQNTTSNFASKKKKKPSYFGQEPRNQTLHQKRNRISQVIQEKSIEKETIRHLNH